MDGYGIIYKATSPSGKVYVGQTIYGLEFRCRTHEKNACNKKHRLYNIKYYRAIRKYDKNIKWIVLHDGVSKNMLNNLERKEIRIHDSYRLGYNSDLGGNVKTTEQLKENASKGEDHHFAKLNWKLVKLIRKMYSSGEYNYKNIANSIKNIVTKETIGKIIRNNRWHDPKYKQVKYAQKGSRNNRAKLTEENVIEIRQKYASGKYSQKELSDIYKVKKPAIYKIIHKITWIDL